MYCVIKIYCIQGLNGLNVPLLSNNARHRIPRAKTIVAVVPTKHGKSTGIDNITTEMVQAEQEATTDILLVTCNKMLQTRVWQKR